MLASLCRLKYLSAGGIRQLYSAAALGVDGFVNTRLKIKDQFKDIDEKFKLKMKDFVKADATSMIFTEDLKHMVHLTENSESDLDLVYQMMLKFSRQNKDTRFGTFVFGPVVMRMYYHLDKPTEALKVFKELHQDGFFDQLISYQILMDLLLKNGMYLEVIEVFEIIKTKQLQGSKFPKNAVVLVLAACYKLNNSTSFDFAKKLWTDLNKAGNYPMRRAGTFAAALAIEQQSPDIALEILTSMKQQGYVTIRNLKVLALANLGRPEDTFPLLKAVLETDKAAEKSTVCEEIIEKLSAAIEKSNRKELLSEYEKILAQLKSAGHISTAPLSDLLCAEISLVSTFETRDPLLRNRTIRRANYKPRPGLQDMD